jgi:hypothetical protein
VPPTRGNAVVPGSKIQRYLKILGSWNLALIVGHIRRITAVGDGSGMVGFGRRDFKFQSVMPMFSGLRVK